MENWLNIELNYKNHFSYGMYHSGFDLLHFLYLEHLTDQAFSDVKLSGSGAMWADYQML